jgi:hydrogen cyanide synthase HcnB
VNSDPLVVIVGAGPAGMAAARTLVEGGLRPLVLDKGPTPGGRLWQRSATAGFAHRLPGYDPDLAERAVSDFLRIVDRIDWYPGTTVLDATRDRLWAMGCDGAIDQTRWDALLVATGALDRVVPLPGWTLPGVYTLGGAQAALKIYGCAIGRRVAFFGTGPLLWLVAAQHLAAGIEVALVADTSRRRAALTALPDLLSDATRLMLGLACVRMVARAGVPIRRGVRKAIVGGGETVHDIAVETSGGRWHYACDAVAMGFGLVPQAQLLDLLDVPFDLEPATGVWLPRTDRSGRTPIPRVYAAGDGVRVLGAAAAKLSGERAALAILEDFGRPVDSGRAARLERELARQERFARGLARAFPFPGDLEAGIAEDTVVCRCESVTAGAIVSAVRTFGHHEVNAVKALSRCGMGRCQGRLCGLAAARIGASAAGVPLGEAGRLRAQAPIEPLPARARRVGAEANG